MSYKKLISFAWRFIKNNNSTPTGSYAQLAYVMAFERPHTHNFHIQHAHVSYECHVLIYTKRSVVKSWRMLVVHDSSKQSWVTNRAV